MKKNKWTLPKLISEASKYNTRGDFKKHCNAGYIAMNRYFGEYKDEITSHMISGYRVWTLGEIKQVALKYQTRNDFLIHERSCHDYLHKNLKAYIPEVTEHMQDRYNKVTLVEIRSEALKYNTRTEFARGSVSHYIALIRKFSSNIDDVCSHMVRGNRGFNPNKPAILYYLSINNGQAYKIGITNHSVEVRYSSKDLAKIKVINVIEYSNGKDAYKSEQLILKEYSYAKYEGDPLLESGNTELFTHDVLLLDLSESANDKKDNT